MQDVLKVIETCHTIQEEYNGHPTLLMYLIT